MRHFTIAVIIFLYLFTILADIYILRDIRCYLRGKKGKIAFVSFSIIAVVMLALLTATIILQIQDYPRLYNVMWILFSYLSIFIPAIIYTVFSAIGKIFRCKKNGRSVNHVALAGFLVACFVFLSMWWGVFFTRNEILVKSIDYFNDNIPDSFDGYRIVQLSDAHLGTWGQDTVFVSRLVDTVNSLKPDVILFTGDIVNRETAELAPFLKTLSRLKAKDGVYSVLGNHDYGDYAKWRSQSEKAANLELMKVWQRQLGWKLLNNEHTFLTNDRDSIALIGVENWGEPPFKQYGNLSKAYSGEGTEGINLYDDKFKLLLSHNPEHWNQEVTSISNIDLTLSGHTHAMQMEFELGNWKWSPAKWKYPLWEGVYERENSEGKKMTLYVNTGCGEVGIPARYGTAYPEITLIRLKR